MTFAAARDEHRRRVVLAERAQARELLREPLVDLAEPDLGIDLDAASRVGPEPSASSRARGAERLGERRDVLALRP